MADVKLGEPFGLDPAILKKIDWSLALKRISHDVRTDFVYAPQLALIFARAGDELANKVKGALGAGSFSPGMPLTIEVPKSFRMQVATPLKRLGPNFSRPGSILLPRDRLFYQVLADQAAPIIDAKMDHSRSFSHNLGPGDSAAMFLPSRTCWQHFKAAMMKHSAEKSIRYVLKIDIANFFGSINQHTLINVLVDAGYSSAVASRLEAVLTSFTGERSSRGILQGLFPSDLFGNFYAAPIDRLLHELGIRSARYVDDIYIFLESVEAAERLLRDLIPALRSYDLVLNEAKCKVMPKAALVTEEPDLEELFQSAVEEISEQVDDDDFDADYGFVSEWDDEDGEVDEEELELEATKLLFDSIAKYTGHEENIERFCLPLFSKAGSDYAVEHVVNAFKMRPAMAQIYASYLAKFVAEQSIQKTLTSLLADSTTTDWQRMWVVAALIQGKPYQEDAIKIAFELLKDPYRHDALRAVAAIYVGQYGDHGRRKALASIYAGVTEYIRLAIYYSSRNWPGVERQNAKAIWGGHGELNGLVTCALAKK